jgi:2-polyprenyl-6-methoxyphenol hydroxylase-like FAD-dependent oxidoreductase
VREAHVPGFGASVAFLTNKFAWYGTTRRFETLTQTFVRTDHGVYNAHHYRYSPSMSTFIVETDAATFELGGFARMNAGDTKTHLEQVFAAALDGHGLVENRSMWRSFPKVRNRRWHVGNCVLLGDALRTLHFSIGSGTRLALEDAIALADALHAYPRDLPAALAAYEQVRRPIAEKLIAAADASAEWYERFGEHMEFAPLDFAMSYLTRSGRVDPARLRQQSPQFMAAYEAR